MFELARIAIEDQDQLARASDMLSKSGMFPDCKTPAQVAVKLMVARDMGLTATQVMTGLHMVKGKPFIGSGASRSKG